MHPSDTPDPPTPAVVEDGAPVTVDLGDPLALGLPDNADEQAAQAAQLTEPVFDHHLDDEVELLSREFGPADADGVFARSAAAGAQGDESGAR